jgi:hypothetical protein
LNSPLLTWLNASEGNIQNELAPNVRLEPNQPERVNAARDRLLDALSEAVSLLRPAQEHIERLHQQPVEAEKAHRRDAVDLTAAEMREMGTKAELERALFNIACLERQIASLRRPWWRWR